MKPTSRKQPTKTGRNRPDCGGRRERPDWVWNWQDGATQSALRLFRTCPHQFWLTYCQGWRAMLTSTAIEQGSAFHHLLEGGLAEGYILKRRLETPPAVRTADWTDNLHWAVAIAEWSYQHYQAFWEKHPIENKVSEAVFDVDGPAGLRLRGKIDGYGQLKDARTGRTLNVVIETKYRSQIDEETTKAALPYQFQPLLYAYALQRLTGIVVDGIVLDVVRRPALRPRQSETVVQYLDRLTEDYHERPAWYFMRWLVRLEPGDVDRWAFRCLEPLARRLQEWWRSIVKYDDPFQSPLHYLNDDALVDGFSRCALFHLITDGSTFGLYRVTKPFPELEPIEDAESSQQPSC